MIAVGSRRLVLFAAAGLLAALASACSSSGQSGGPTTTVGTSAPGTTASAIPARTDPCSEQVVVKAIQSQDAGATVQDVVCGNAAAIATLGAGAGTEVAFLTAQNGAWAIVGRSPVGGDLTKALPAGMSPSLLDAWKAKHGSRTSPTTVRSAAAGGPISTVTVLGDAGGGQGQDGGGNYDESNPTGGGGGSGEPLSPECATTIASAPCVLQ